MRALVLACAVLALGAACSGTEAAEPTTPSGTQRVPEQAAPAPSKLPGADAFAICDSAGDYWPTMVAAATGPKVWIACKEESKLIPVDAETGKAGEAVETGVPLIATLFAFDSLWALDIGGTIHRLDPETGEIRSRIDAAASKPYNLWEGDGSIWTIDDATGEVIRISPETEEVVARMEVGDGPASMVFDGTTAWVVNHRDLKLSKIDTKTNKAKLLTTLSAPNGAPERLALLGGSLWVTGRGVGLLEVSPDTGKVLQTIDLDFSGIDVVAAGDALWVPTRSADVDQSGFPTASDLKKVTADGTVESVTPTEPFDVHGLVADDTSLWLADTTGGVLYKLPLS